MKTSFLLGIVLLATTFKSSAHEYWLDAIDSTIVHGESAIVDIRNGQDFNGSAFPYNKTQLDYVVVKGPVKSQPYTGRLGDYPALHPQLNADGIHSINLTTSGRLLTYESWQKFNTFLEYHGLDIIKARHLELNLPKKGIKEQYFRSAKTLIQVNDSGDLILEENASFNVEEHNAFTPSGGVFEMLLLDNPYSQIESLRIKLIHNSVPLAGRQVEMFWKGSTLLRLTAKTDEAGIATFKLLGEGDYLLNAVQMAEPENYRLHWLSYWASVTFER